MKIFDLVAKYHYGQVVNNPSYRKTMDKTNNWTEKDIEDFKQFLRNLEDMSEDNNKGINE